MEEQIIPQQRESIKLIKNTKGHNWELKILDIDFKGIGVLDIDRLENLNLLLEKKFSTSIL